jgi:hypothetical protein
MPRLGAIDVRAERILYGHQIRIVAVRGEPHAVLETRGDPMNS